MKNHVPAFSRRPGDVAIHSVDCFVFSVPDLSVAREFYIRLGLDVRANGNRLDLYTFGHPHCWAYIYQAGERKQLQFVRYGIFAEDESVFRQRIAERSIGTVSHQLGSGDGLWLRDPDGVALQLMVTGKVSPSALTQSAAKLPMPAGQVAAPSRSGVAPVSPRNLSHILQFTPDVPRMLRFCSEVLGLRLSDQSGDLIVFTHTPHGSDHHLVAFAESHAPGLHHSSWDVAIASTPPALTSFRPIWTGPLPTTRPKTRCTCGGRPFRLTSLPTRSSQCLSGIHGRLTGGQASTLIQNDLTQERHPCD